MSRPETLISVIVPAYNYAHLLPRALDSVLAQLADDVELIVVNDGSTDQTSALLADYQGRYPAIRIIEQENGGAASARNHGIREANGRYALMLDADDELLPDALSCLRQMVAHHPEAGMLLGGYVSVYEDGRERQRMPTAVPAAPADQLIRQYLLEKRIAISHGCSMFRRDLLMQRPYPESLRNGEDIAVFAFLLISAPVALTTQPLVRIYKHSDSLRHSRTNGEAYVVEMVHHVFSSLPASCQPLKARYEAQRYLSLFRAALLAGEAEQARYFYKAAFKRAPVQALGWSYLRKALRLMMQA
ncbi:glycosyltransferase family 2 protein [Pseudomonas xionganensis]|uniref:Glycosyltransferase n=1 Tax=Pseudomonas xionganensis TaxID=2654845 RepID=A0A6I4KVT6_9PSED|nr:glycosyltransferase family 2 protein [Pseudomonas xionganensis]MVW74636.1 glycosyltransferase [Pseudomonas xionganensis]